MVLVTGPNGSGKTNLLEALHVGTQGFSPRSRNDARLIRFGAVAGRVRLRGTNGRTPFESHVDLSVREARRTCLNGERLHSADQLRGDLPALVFTPDRLAVVKGSPSTRRAYVDRSVGRAFPSRATLPLEYGTAVGQRNAALRRIAAGSSSRAALDPWTEQVIELGQQLVTARVETLELLAPRFSDYAGQLGVSDASVTYAGDPATREDYEHRLDSDLQRGVTGLGPHLHEVRLAAGDRELRSYGSQGEQRVAVLALVLAEAALLAERGPTAPLVLLDDVLSELDEQRRLALAQLVSTGGQAVVTATAASSFPLTPAQSLVVAPGTVRAE